MTVSKEIYAINFLPLCHMSQISWRGNAIYSPKKTHSTTNQTHSHTVVFPLFLETHYTRNIAVAKSLIF